MSDKAKRRLGRPPKPLDLEDLKRIARTGATHGEMAARLRMSEDTLQRRLQDQEVCALVDEAQAEVKISLRAKQVQLALAGDRTMLVWLGKQWLGQKDRLDHAVEVSGGLTLAEIARQRLAKLHAEPTPAQVIDAQPIPQMTTGQIGPVESPLSPPLISRIASRNTCKKPWAFPRRISSRQRPVQSKS